MSDLFVHNMICILIVTCNRSCCWCKFWVLYFSIAVTTHDSDRLCLTLTDSAWLWQTRHEFDQHCMTLADSAWLWPTLYYSGRLRISLADSVWHWPTLHDSSWRCMTLTDALWLWLTVHDTDRLTAAESILMFLMFFKHFNVFISTVNPNYSFTASLFQPVAVPSLYHKFLHCVIPSFTVSCHTLCN